MNQTNQTNQMDQMSGSLLRICPSWKAIDFLKDDRELQIVNYR
ncbi:hypothetical protein [Paenibacillus gallinarum]|nr:hypothetical protein [Paenibacillus gallinarum]